MNASSVILNEEVNWHSLDRLPRLPFKAPVNGLSDGGLHEVHIAHHQGSIQILQVFMELPIAQII